MRKIFTMFNCCIRFTLAGVLLASSSSVWSENDGGSPNDPDKKELQQVEVMKFSALGANNGRVVVKRCEGSDCETVDLRIDTDSELLNEGIEVTLTQAEQLEWKYALLVVSEQNTVAMLVRVNAFH